MTRSGVYLWRGQTYIGRDAVAKAAGVGVTIVDYHLRVHGHLDRLGQGQHRQRPQAAAKPVEAHGRTWPSRTALAGELGVSLTTACRWVRADDDRLLAALMAADARKTAAALKGADMIDRFGKAVA